MTTTAVPYANRAKKTIQPLLQEHSEEQSTINMTIVIRKQENCFQRLRNHWKNAVNVGINGLPKNKKR